MVKKLNKSLIIDHLEVNPDKKIVVCNAGSILTHMGFTGFYVSSGKSQITKAKTCPEDEFDPYVGSALAICYNLFGSKSQFHKYVNASMKEFETRQEVKKKTLEKKAKTKAKNLSSKVVKEASAKRKRGRPSKQK